MKRASIYTICVVSRCLHVSGDDDVCRYLGVGCRELSPYLLLQEEQHVVGGPTESTVQVGDQLGTGHNMADSWRRQRARGTLKQQPYTSLETH